MVKEIEIKMPTSYADISLKKWLVLQNELKSYEDDEEATVAILLSHLCNLPFEYHKGLSVDDYIMIKTELNKFLSIHDLPLQKFITIDGVEYGFEPNLSEMSYGAYLDITKFKNINIDENWSKIMSILYRPVTNKSGTHYSIKTYNGSEDKTVFDNVGMDVHFGALFFLYNLLMDLLKDILKSSMEMDLAPTIKQILARSGQHILQSLNSPMEILPNSTPLLKSH